jgi:hypothetical protein
VYKVLWGGGGQARCLINGVELYVNGLGLSCTAWCEGCCAQGDVETVSCWVMLRLFCAG